MQSGDERWPTTGALVDDAAERFGEAIAVEDAGVQWSFRDLADMVDDIARALVARRIAHGDRVALWAPNIPEWIPMALAVHRIGAILVPLNTRYKGREAAYVLQASRARLLCTVEGFLETDYVGMLATCGVELPHLASTVLLRGTAEGTTSLRELIGEGEAVSDEEFARRRAAVSASDPSDIMFTSGTTGHPKGVVATHGQSLRAFAAWSRLVGLQEGDRYLVVNPFFHTFGYKAGILAALMRGAVVIPHAVFDAGQVLERIAAQRITMLPGPPALYQSILAHPDLAQHDLGSLRLAVTGAATIPVSLIEQMRDRLGFDVVLTAYGLTEATGVVSMCRVGDDVTTVATTSGCAIPDVEVRIVDEANQPVAAGVTGEVVVRGYNVMQGYFEDPERTAETIDSAGWLHTGDIGVLDERGYLDITDRLKDMFIVGGFNAYPAEIENALVEHPDVVQAAVVGVADERLGEVGWAFVVAPAAVVVDEAEVIAWSRERMANFKVPRRVVQVDALPVNASGKVLKNELRERARSQP